MQRQDVWLKPALLLALPLALCGCLTIELGSSKDETEAEADAEAEAGQNPAAAADLADFPDGGSFLPENLTSAATTATPQLADHQQKPEFRIAKWDRNPSRAISKAKALDRPLLILFTALGWNENAVLLSTEVFMSKTFNEFAGEHLILSYLDYPKTLTAAPDSIRAMKEKYQVHGYPTILLLDPKGNELYRDSGYIPGRARDYFSELRAATLEFRGVPADVGPVEFEGPPKPPVDVIDLRNPR